MHRDERLPTHWDLQLLSRHDRNCGNRRGPVQNQNHDYQHLYYFLYSSVHAFLSIVETYRWPSQQRSKNGGDTEKLGDRFHEPCKLLSEDPLIINQLQTHLNLATFPSGLRAVTTPY